MNTRFEPGAPVQDGFIPLAVPSIHGNEWEYVKECLATGWVSSVGSYVERFEKSIAESVGSQFAVATTSGTAALHVSLQLARVEAGDDVVIPSLTFIAPANAVRYLGAWPLIVDVEDRYWQIDVEKLAEFFSTRCDSRDGSLRNRETGRRIAAMLPVHILGHPCDMDALVELAARYNLPVIEDATEALGARYKGRAAGSIGKAGCFSFNGNKLITTGGGGMIVTDDDALARKARYLTTQAKDDPVEYVHHEVGYNYRLTNVQAAMGCAQLEGIAGRLASKRSAAAFYAEQLNCVPGIRMMEQAPWAESGWWLSTIRVDEAQFGMDRRELLNRLERQQIQTRPLWEPMHLSRAHAGSFHTDCSMAEQIWREALSLPSSVGITPDELGRVTDAITRLKAS